MPGPDMLPTLHEGQDVLVDTLAYQLHEPDRGDIVEFTFPGDPQITMVQRVIGVPGDQVVIRDRAVYCNGLRLREPYATQEPIYSICPVCTVTVPKGSLFLLGDNRRTADDSHEWGLLPSVNVVGRVIVIQPSGITQLASS